MLTQVTLLVVLILLSAFFSGSEMALISLNDYKIRSMAEDGNKKAGMVKKLLSEPGKFLATIQIGNTFSGFLASAFAAQNFTGIFVEFMRNLGLGLSEDVLSGIAAFSITILLSFFNLLFGELLPKRVAMKKAESFSMAIITPLNLVSKITSPFVKLLNITTNAFVRLFGIDPNQDEEHVTEEEILLMVDVGEEKGTIHETEKEMINNIFEFNNKTIDEIMTHRTEIAALPIDAEFDEVINFVNDEKYSRIPVYEDNIDNIVGILHSKQLIQYMIGKTQKDEFKLSEIIRQPYCVPTSKRTDILFKELQRNNTHMAVVIDEYGGTAGIVTLEDLLEEIVGNIFDEYDEIEKEIEKLDESTFIINGITDLDFVSDYFSVDLPTDNYDTLGGFIMGQLGRIPAQNDESVVEYNGLLFKVIEVDEKRVAKVKVCKI